MNKQAIWFIVNPFSGRKKNHQEIVQLIDSQLDKKRYLSKIIYTQYAGHGTEIGNEAAKQQVPFVVAVGGDGTVNEIGKTLISSKTALGIIPTGSGNGLARELNISMKPLEVIKSFNSLTIKSIDVCFANETPFFCTAGVGFDAHCAEVFARTKGRGMMNYVKVGVQEFWKYKPLKCIFGGNNYEVFSITFGNACQFGNNAFITPSALIDDGYIDCTIINPPPAWEAPRLISQLFNRTIDDSDYAEVYRGTQFALTSGENFLIHYDGEPLRLSTNELKISILEKSLKVIV